jgi:hypothetical protein
MKKYVLPGLLIFLMSACREKKEEKQEDFLPALPFIQNDVKDVDTSLYPIIKITWVDTTDADTVFVKREGFRDLAVDFLQIPDIASDEYKKRYTEEKFYDQSLNTVIFTYRPKNAEKEEIQRQEILISPNPTGDKVRSIIVERLITNKDSSVMKRMLWQINKSFQVVTSIQKPNIPERNFTLKVVWNEPLNH